MRPALWQRLPDAAHDRDTDRTGPGRRAMARSLAFLFAAGATLALLSLALPHSPRTDEAGILVLLAIAYAIAGVLVAGSDRLPSWVCRLALACGSVLITCAIHFSGQHASAYALFYVWICLFSFYFFSCRQAALQIVFVGLAYGVLLAWQQNLDVTRWVLTLGTLVVAGALITTLKNRLDHLIDRLSDAARTDPLTSLPNRRSFEERFDQELERSRRNGKPVAVIVGDLDDFKHVNDRLGHHAGDDALKGVARILSGAKRLMDTAARMGGEEFALLLPESDEHAAYGLAERLRVLVRDAYSQEQARLTISFGIASLPAQASTGEALLRAADQALYAAKELGRNRSVIYSAEVTSILSRPDDGRRPHGEVDISGLLALAEALDLRDIGTAKHCQTVGRYADGIAREMRLPREVAERIRLAGILHDIGKVGVPNALLRKRGPLSDAEWQEMRKHPEVGARILGADSVADIGDWILAHHERPDGNGYPRGLLADDIPLPAKIIAVADAYEAMTADRPYRQALGHEAAREELRRCAGTQFDPGVVSAFLRVLNGERRSAVPAEQQVPTV